MWIDKPRADHLAAGIQVFPGAEALQQFTGITYRNNFSSVDSQRAVFEQAHILHGCAPFWPTRAGTGDQLAGAVNEQIDFHY